ncbi:ATP-binding protein [Candidatus Woesearchaeota archaeon]|nr:ATP-binding protein [Candidatus Woesearchaeota archaeon]
MEAAAQIKRFEEFVQLHHHTELLENVRNGLNYLTINFQDLAKFDVELANTLLDQPEESIKAAESSIYEFDLPKKIKDFRIRFKSLPKTQHYMIRDIRSTHINKFVATEGIVRQKSDVRPQVTSARFECPSCGNVISVLQLEQKFREPSRCGCGRKGKFKLLSKGLVDAQRIVLEESPDMLEGGEQPKRMDIFLKQDLVSPLSDRKTNPGTKIKVNGLIKEVPIQLREGGQSIRFDLMVDANFIETVEEEFGDIIINEEEVRQIKELAASKEGHEKIIQSLAPSIYGHDKVKEAIMLQLVGGRHKTREEGNRSRGDIHILLIGDPGSGKCVAGDTKLVLYDGSITTIGELVKNRSYPSLAICEKDGKIMTKKPKRHWKRKSPKTLLQVTTASGKQITLTKEHPLFTISNGMIHAKAAKDMRVGQYVATPRKLNCHGKPQYLKKPFTLSNSNHQQKLTFPTEIDRQLARLLGYLLGDGYVAKSATSAWISFTNTNKELIQDYQRLVKSIFNGNTTVRKRKQSEEAYITSVSIFSFLKSIGDGIAVSSAQKKIPQAVNRSPPGVLKEFIRALFECEAYINLKKRQIEFSTISKNLAEDLQTNLLKFGIISLLKYKIKYAANTKEKRKIPAYDLIISGDEASRFISTISFVSKEKKRKAARLYYERSMAKSNTNIDIIPATKMLLRGIRKELGLYQRELGIPRTTVMHYERGDRNPSRQAAQAIVTTLQKHNAKNDAITILKQLAFSDIFWDKIVLIKKVKTTEKNVYDLEIPDHHNFIANSIIIHNSQLLKRTHMVAPKARYVSGKGASGAGLTAAVVKDEFLRGWALEAGALVLANHGFVMIDELDKMSKEDRSAMHEALEQQTVTISKANIQATLRSETTVLAAANPKFGRFDPYEMIAKQIDLPPTLINRFDLIFPIKDLPDTETDKKLSGFILRLHQKKEAEKTPVPTDLLKKFIAYARKNCYPELTDDAIEEIQQYYISMRNSGSDEGGIKAIPITARQLEALVRLSEANAKLRLSSKVMKEDARKAIEIVDYCLRQVGLDKETGKIDIDRISTGISASQRGKISVVKEIITELEAKVGKSVPLKVDDVVALGAEKNVTQDAIEEVLEKLKRSGDIFEPKRGFVQRI